MQKPLDLSLGMFYFKRPTFQFVKIIRIVMRTGIIIGNATTWLYLCFISSVKFPHWLR